VIGKVLTFVFTLESGVKMMALGVVMHEKAYFRDAWNILDFFVVATGLVELWVPASNFKSLRTFRVLRPLKSINAVPSMRNLVAALLKSLPDFINVATFLSFIFVLFSILGLHIYSDAYYY
jgi:hypothetical protein